MESLTSDPSLLTAPIKRVEDKFALLPAFLKVRGLVKQHLDSYNFLLNHDLRKIVMANEKVTCDTDPNFFLRWEKGLCVLQICTNRLSCLRFLVCLLHLHYVHACTVMCNM